MHFGSTERPISDHEQARMAKAAKVANNTATISGCSIELQIQKQHIERQQSEINSLKGLIMTLQGQFDQFQQQRAIELSQMLGGGPTEKG